MNRFSELVGLAREARLHVEELRTTVKLHAWSAIPSSLMGACGVASLHLVNMAQKRGMNPSFVRGKFLDDGHCWVEYYGCIVDITATQFIPCEPVHVRSIYRSDSPYHAKGRSKNIVYIEKKIKRWTLYADELKSLA